MPTLRSRLASPTGVTSLGFVLLASMVFATATCAFAADAKPATSVSAADPVPEVPVRLVQAVRGAHPRLLFTGEELELLRAFVQTETGQRLWREMLRYVASSRPPKHTRFLRDATDAQRQGFWRMPTVGLHHLITGHRASKARSIGFLEMLLDLEHWELGKEKDAGMAAANLMVGAALLYDWLYHDLEPDFRDRFRDKLLLQARRMYYLGHLRQGVGGGYWSHDPQNNHRWHRNAGLVLAAIAVADPDKTDDDWLLAKVRDELAFVVKWLPDDGTQHESPSYLQFGASHLLLAVTAADRCLGTEHLQAPFFRNVDRFLNQTLTPGFEHRFPYGDMGGTGVGPLEYGVFQFQTLATHRRFDQLARLQRLYRAHGVGVTKAWLGVLWYPRLELPAQVDHLPTDEFFPDLGLQVVRDAWHEGGVAAMFKCGPLGGYTLNRYRAEHGFPYVNVAHDDPDANAFVLFANGRFLAETDRYSTRKNSANHNTILINGAGQSAHRRPDTQHWTQPARGRRSMHDAAVVTARATRGKHLAIEGDASGAYPADTTGVERPGLTRYRRSFLWVEGKYVLVLDDIRAPESVDIAWLMQGPDLVAAHETKDETKDEPEDAAAGRYRLVAGDAACPFHVVATVDGDAAVVDSLADHRGKPLGWRQLRLRFSSDAVRIASAYNPWSDAAPTVVLQPRGADTATVSVTLDGETHTWQWTAGEQRLDPSRIHGTTADGQTILRLHEADPETRQLLQSVDTASQPAR